MIAHDPVIADHSKLGEFETMSRRPETCQTVARCNPLPAVHVTDAFCNAVAQTLLAENGVPQAIQALADMIGNPVVLQDRFLRVIAHSLRQSAIDDHRVEIVLVDEVPNWIFEHETTREQMKALRKNQRPVRLPPCPKYGMKDGTLVVPICYEGDVRGFISVIESNRQLAASETVVLEHVANVLGLELRRQQTAADVEARMRGSLLDELVSGRYSSEEALRRRALSLGYDLNRPYDLMIVEVAHKALGDGAQPALSEKVLGRCHQLVREVLARMVRGEDTTVKSGAIVAVLPARARETTGKAQRRVDELAKAVRIEIISYLPDLTISIGIGRECRRLSDYSRAYLEAQQTLSLLASFGRQDETASFDALGVYSLFLDYGDPSKLERFVQSQLGRVLEYDRKHGADLLHTLEVFLREGCNLQKTADALFVHVNSVRYRLQRVDDLSGVDTRDFEACLNLQVAIKILRMRGKYDGKIAPEEALGRREVRVSRQSENIASTRF